MTEKDLETVVRGVVSEVLSRKSGYVPENPANFRKDDRPVPLTEKEAERLCKAVLSRAEEIGVNAVVCVSDAGGHPLCLLRKENAFIASIDIAMNKAFTSVSLKMPTKNLATLAAPGGSLYGIQFTNGGKIVIFGGGEPLKRENVIVGGFGVSGGTAEQDTALGEFAARYFAKEMQ